MEQFEGSLFSLKKVQDSSRNLRLLGYLDNITVTTPKVPGEDDQVDVNYNVKEAKASAATFQVGYGTDGFLIGASLTQPNFLGTGDTLNLSATHQSYVQNYNITFIQPFFRVNGMSRSFSVYYNRYDPDELDLADFTNNNYGAAIGFGVPLTLNNSLNLSLGYSVNKISLGNPNGTGASTQLQNYIDAEGADTFPQALLTSTWIYQGLDRAIFPTQGYYQDVNGSLAEPAGSNGLQYYKLWYDGFSFLPLNHAHTWIIETRVGGGYGLSLIHI